MSTLKNTIDNQTDDTQYNNKKMCHSTSCGLYYKHVMIVIYDRNDSVQYHKTTITIVIDDP